MAKVKDIPITQIDIEKALKDADEDEQPGMNGIRLCQKEKLCILGTAGSLPQAPYDDLGYEIWTIGQAVTYPQCKRYDLLFELHTSGYWKKHPPVQKRLAESSAPLYMHDVYKEIPLSMKFPLDELMARYRKYYTTSIAYMLALALYSAETIGKPAHIAVYGIHMESAEEYTEQRPCVEYWLARLEQAGVDLMVHPGGAIFKSKILYGYESFSPYCLDLKQRLVGLRAGMEEWQRRANYAEGHRWKHLGAIEEDERILRALQNGEVSLENTPLSEVGNVDFDATDSQFPEQEPIGPLPEALPAEEVKG